jgi:hypothetical protein
MMKKIILIFSCLIVSVSIFTQEIKIVSDGAEKSGAASSSDSLKHWHFKGFGSLSVTQAAYANWSAGGQNSVGLVALVNLSPIYLKGKHAWASIIDLGYGFQFLGEGSDATFSKTDDKIEITSSYGYQIHKNKKWYFSVLVNFRSQFANGYKYPDDSTVISRFMAPGYLVAGLGITYNPFRGFRIYLSPASGRFTFVTDQTLSNAGAFGVDPGKTMRTELGPYLRADLNQDLAKNINLTSSLELFTDYFKDFGNIDVNWNVLLSLKVNKWLAATINTQLIYDDDVTIKKDANDPGGPRTQFKEMIGVGLSYKME